MFQVSETISTYGKILQILDGGHGEWLLQRYFSCAGVHKEGVHIEWIS